MSLLSPDLRSRIGETRVYEAPEPVGRAAIRYYALSVGDMNPVSHDLEAAMAAGHPDLVAPPTLICDTNQYAGLPPDEHGYAGHSWGFDIPGTRQIRGGNSYTFERPVIATDVITATWTIDDISERTSRSGAEMIIVTSTARYTDAEGALVATNSESIIFQEILP